MAYTHHGRDQIAYITMGAKSDGTVTGVRARLVCDLGAYFQLLTPFIPELGFPVAGGCYAFDAIDLHFTGVFTNKFATDAIRGAGRPEMTHWVEVMMDRLALEVGSDPVEIRRKNFIPEDKFPYETPLGIVYDSGNYEGTLDRMLEMLDLDGFRREQEELRGQGIHRGVGLSTYTEVCGLAPSRAVGPQGVGLQAAFYESATVRVHPTGSATVYSGASPHGQGLDTSFAQITADRLGISPENIEVVHGDTNSGPWGWGTYGSRSISVGGEAVARAAERVQAKAKTICAAMLEAAPEDIELAGGEYRVKGQPDKKMSMADIAGAAYIPPQELPTEIEPGLEETAFYDPENFVFPFGAHACVVDVDVDTGKVEIVRWVAVDDCGPAINPMLIDGQIHGGIVHGIGQALYEQIVYDADGQLVTGSFVDYALPTAAEVPTFETDRTETPSPVNSLGVKGIGEAGTIAASPAVLNAVVDALRPFGVDYIDMPLTPMRVWQAIDAAKGNGSGPAASEQGARARRARRGRRRIRTYVARGRRRIVIPAEFDYHRAESVDDAVRALADGGEDAKLLAGGHSLVPLMKLRLAAPSLLVDISELDELRGIEADNGTWRIGPGTHHAELQGRDDLGVVAHAASLIADQQVRNRGTIGGSIAHADPASDLPTVLLAAEGSVEAQGPSGSRTIAAARPVPGLPDDGARRRRGDHRGDDARRSTAGAGAMRSSPAARRTGRWSASARWSRHRAASARTCASGSPTWARPHCARPRPRRRCAAAPLDAERIAAAAEQAAEGTDPPGDLNATPDYKRHLARTLTRRALEQAAGPDRRASD